jgi:hypothetical protein
MFDEREEMLRREAIACEAAYASGLVERPKSAQQIVESLGDNESVEIKLLKGQAEAKRTREIALYVHTKLGMPAVADLIEREFLK